MYQTILVPSDFSECGETAWNHAVQLAKVHNSRIVVLYVVEPVMSHYGLVGLIPGVKELEEQHDIASRLKLKELVDHAEEQGLTVEGKILTGKPSRCVLDAAKDAGADLIIMGTHGRSGLAHDNIGSTAERVVQKSGVPVLVVHPEHCD